MPVVFHGFELDLEQGRLLRDGREVALERRVFELLYYFAQNAERLITKDELMRDVWRAHSLTSSVMGNAVAKLRRALGQSPDASLPIETVHGRGYRFWLGNTVEPQKSNLARMHADPFLGRERVIETLVHRLELAHSGESKLTLLAGNAGIGKTRAAREIAERARALGFRTLRGAAYEGEIRAPHWPFTQMLRQAREELGAERFSACVPPDAVAIGLVLPELATSIDTPQASLEPAAVRFKLFDAVTRVFAALSHDAPLLLVFDDLHWADRATIELLAFAARALEGKRVAWLANLRDDALAQTDDRRTDLAILDRLAMRIDLPGLTLEAVAALAGALEAPNQDPAAVRALHVRTGGNPFFVRQLIEAAIDEEQTGIAPEARANALPSALRSVLNAKLGQLDANAREAAEAAAVIGREFTVSSLAAALDQAPDRALESIEQLAFAQIIEQRTGTDRFEFVHDLLREALYTGLALRSRGALHARIARWLEAQPDGERAEQQSEIAQHYLHALPSQLTAAIAACRRAASAAHESGGFEASARLLSLAIGKLDAEHGDPHLRCELSIELGTSYFHALDIDRAWSAYREAAECAEQLERVELSAQLVPHLVNCIELVAGDAAYVRRLIERTLSRLPPEHAGQRASLLAHQAELATELPASLRTAMLDEADALAARSGDPASLLEVAHSRSTLRDPTTLAQNRAAADRLLQLIDQHRDHAGTLRYRLIRRLSAEITHYVAALTSCDLAAADRAFRAIGDLAQTSGVRAVALTVEFMRAGRVLAAGDLATLEQIVSRGLIDQREFSSRAGLVFGRYALSLMHARGVLGAVDFDLSAVQVPSVTRRHETDSAIAKAHLYALTGKPERAEAALAEIPAETLARMPVLFGDLGLLCQLAEATCRVPTSDLTDRVFHRLQPYAAFNALLPHFEYWGAVAHYLGMLAKKLERSDARSYFEQALEINRALNMPLRAAATQRELAAL